MVRDILPKQIVGSSARELDVDAKSATITKEWCSSAGFLVKYYNCG